MKQNSLKRYSQYYKYKLKEFIPKSLWFKLAELKKKNQVRIMNQEVIPNNRPEAKYYVIRREPPAAGLFSNMNHVFQGLIAAQASNLNPVIDMQNYWTDYSQPSKYQNTYNAWEYFFEQPFNFKLEEVYKNEIYDSSPLNRILKNHWLGYKNLSFVFDRNKMEELYELQQRFILLNNFSANLIDKVKESISWDPISTLGASYRGTDYLEVKPHGHAKQPAMEDFYYKVLSHQIKLGLPKLFIASEDLSLREYFRESGGTYPNFRDFDYFKKFIPRNRMLKRFPEKKIVTTYSYLVEIYLLSETESLVTSLANGSVMALILNGGKYRDPFIFDLGSY